jgi:hypothetical protein
MMSNMIMKYKFKMTGPKAWLQEIKNSRKVQIALISLPVLIWLLWPTSSSNNSSVSHKDRNVASLELDSNQLRELSKLPNLSTLNAVANLPKATKTYRDLFLFETQKPIFTSQPPPPPSKEQIEAEKLARMREQENNSWPSQLYYLGYLGTRSSGRLGAFLNSKDSLTIKYGGLVNAHWRLIKLNDMSAEFQNLKFSDLKHVVNVSELQDQDDEDVRLRSNNF